nr:conserved hypothetical protein [Bacteriophage APSE-3]
MTEATQSDNPNDIDSLSTLKIQAVSGNLSPSIYANGRNQLPIEITAKAVNKDGNPLKFSNNTWISILNLCFAESDKKLNRNGNSGWCFTVVENQYSKEIQLGSHRSKRFLSGEDGTAIIILYVYTDDINTKRIAVSVDTPNGKHFTTADIHSGAEKMSVTVAAIQQIIYRKNMLTITPIYELEKGVNKVIYSDGYTREFDCHYDNYYITIPLPIINAIAHGYGNGTTYPKWICAYDKQSNNQHMIVAHPDNTKKGTETFGFEGRATFLGLDSGARFDLTKKVTFSEHDNAICFTQIAFQTGGNAWRLNDGQCLSNFVPYAFDTWFELFDIYGNYGKFNVQFTDDKLYIKITDRYK